MKGDSAALPRWSRRIWPVRLIAFLTLSLATAAPAQDADLALTQLASSPTVPVGNNVSFTIAITNLGPADATSVVLSNFLSAKSTFVSASASQGGCANEAGVVRCNLGNLTAGGEVLVTLLVKTGAGTNINTAIVSSAAPDPNLANNTSRVQAGGTVTLPEFAFTDAIYFEEVEGGPGVPGNPGDPPVFPADITVPAVTALVYKVTVTLRTLSHTLPDDLDFLLVGPSGTNVMLMSDCGIDNALVDVSITLDDDALVELPDADLTDLAPAIVTGSYRPANYNSQDFNTPPPGVPTRPYGTTLGVFAGTRPQGTWSLFAFDDQPEDGGVLADGWTMTIQLGDPIADLEITQRSSPPTVQPGQQVTYTVAVTNRGPAHSRATVTDPLPAGMTFISAVPSRGECTNSGGVVTCDFGNLLVGQGATATLVVSPTAGGTVTNTVSVTGNQLDLFPSNNTASVTTTIEPVADLAVSGSAPADLLVQQSVTWMLAITNRGPNMAMAVVLTNLLPPGVLFLSVTSSIGACAQAAGVVSCDFGALAPDAGGTVAITARAETPGVLTNIARVSGLELDLVATNNVQALLTTVNPAADLSIRQVAGATSVPLGQIWQRTLAVSNLGPSAATAVLTEPLSTNVTFVSAISARGSCINTGTDLVCQFDNLAPGEGASVLVEVRVLRLSLLESLVTVSGSVGDLVLSNNTVRTSVTVVPAANLELRMADRIDPRWIGENVTYILSVSNLGPSPANSVSVSNRLPAGVNFIFAASSQGTCTIVAGTVLCSLGAIETNASATITLVGGTTTVGFVTNAARVLATEIDPVGSNNSAVEITRVIDATAVFPSAGLAVVPELGGALPYPSMIAVTGLTASISRLRVTVTNLSHTYPDDLDLLLVGPGGQAALLLSDVGGDPDANNLTLTFDDEAALTPPDAGPLAPGLFHPSNAELAPDLFPAPAPPGPYGTNLSVFYGTDPNGTWSLFIVDDTVKDAGSLGGWRLSFFTLDPIANVLVIQSPSANPVAVGSNLVLTCRVTNLGPATASAVRLTTTLDLSLSIQSIVASQGGCTNQGGLIDCALGDLPSGAQATVSVTVLPLMATSLTNLALVSATQTDVVPSNNVNLLVLEVQEPPVITLQPASQLVTNGVDVTFTTAATGAEPLAFQWQRNGVDLSTATNSTLFLAGASPASSGAYRVRVSNRVGAVLSSVATLQVVGPPTISDIPGLSIDEDTSTPLLPFIVTDSETPAALLTVSGDSSDPSIVAPANIVFSGTDSNRTVRVTPLPDRSGTVTIFVMARDPEGGETRTSFQLMVQAVNDPPSVSDLGNTSTPEDVPLNLNFLAADLETASSNLIFSATSSNPSLLPTNDVVFGGSGSNRTVTFTPAPEQSGTAVINLTIRDDEGASASDSFQVTVIAVNDSPRLDLIPDLAISEESGARTVLLTGITSGATNETQNLQVTATSSAPALIPPPTVQYTNGSNSGSLTLAPMTNAHGSAVITVTVRDGQATNGSFSRDFTVTVNPTNDSPALSQLLSVTTEEDTAVSFPLSLADPDHAAVDLQLRAESSNPLLAPTNRIALSGTGAERVVTVTPATNQSGAATLTLILTDPLGATNLIAFPLTVTPVNDPPTLNLPNNLNLPANPGPQTVALTGVSAGASDETEPVLLTAVSSNPALLSNLVVNYSGTDAAGNLLFTPAPNAAGTATITVTANDQQPRNSLTTRSFTVTVSPRSDPPTIVNIGNRTTGEDIPISVPVIVGPSTAAPLLTLLAGSSAPSVLAASNIVFSGSGTNRTMTITPLPDRFGTSIVTVTVTNAFGAASNSFSLAVTSSNDVPTLNPIPHFGTNLINSNVEYGLPLTGITSGATNENQALTVTTTSTDTGFLPNPSVIYTTANTNGTIVLRPKRNTAGTATVTVTVTDNGSPARSVSRAFRVSVRQTSNTRPTISAITNLTLNENTSSGPVSFTVNDVETAANSLTLLVASSNPVLLPTNNIVLGGAGANRTFNVMPATNQSGTVSVTLTVIDGSFGLTNRTFSVAVLPVNDPPSISALSNLSTAEDTPTAPVLFTVGDAETPAGSLSVSAISGNTTLVPNANLAFSGSGSNRTLVITPAPNETGAAPITVRVTDGASTNSASFTLTVTTANDPPVISDIPNPTIDGGLSAGPLPFTVRDLETAAGLLTLSRITSDPLLLPTNNIVFGGGGSNRTVTVTPLPGRGGTAMVTVSVADADGGTATTGFMITVNAVNRPPTINPITNVLLNESSGPQVVSLTGITPGAGESNQVVAVIAETTATNLIAGLTVSYASPGTTGQLNFVPVPTAVGSAVVTVRVNDGQSRSNTASRNFTVTLNGAPSITQASDVTTLEDTPVPAVPITIGDTETPAAALTVAARSSNPALVPNPLSGGTGDNRTLAIAPATNQAGVVFITLTVTDTNGAARSNGFYVTVLPVLDPILITQQPQSQTRAAGTTVTLAVTASSTLQPLAYQWQRNDSVLAGGTNPTLALTNVQPGEAGSYRVVLANADGMVTTAVAELRILIEPLIVLISRRDGTAEISFSTVSGQNYTVEFKDVVTDVAWTPLQSVPGSGNVVTVTDASALAPTRFYRVRVD